MDTKPLKGSYDVAKNNIICCNAMCFCGLRLKKKNVPPTVHHCGSSMPRLSETHRLLQSSLFWEARCIVIGRIPQAYLTVLWCRVPARWHKNNKTIINEAFVASSGDIITDYNDLYCLFMHRVTSRHVNITMPVFAIRETTTTSTTLHCSTFTF